MAKLLTGTRIYGTATVDTQLFVSGTTSATSTITGALQVIGGAGIGGNLYVGGTINGNLTGTATTATNLAGGALGSIPYQTAAGTTAFLPIGTNGYVLTVGASSTASWTAISGLSAGSATTATNIAGGLSGQLHYQVGPGNTGFVSTGTAGQVLVSGGTGSPVYQSTLTLASTTAAGSTNTGALQVVGGVGIGGSLYVGNASTFSNTLQIGSGSSGGIFQTLVGGTSFALYSANLVSSAQNYALAYNGASLNLNAPTGGGIYSSINNSIVSTLASTGLTVNVSTAATSTTTGALQVVGGAGIGQALYVGGQLTVSNTNANTATSTSNALYVSGGAYIDKSLVVVQDALFKGPVTFSGSATYILSTNTYYTDNVIEMHTPPSGVYGLWNTDDGKDIGFRFHYYTAGTDTNAALVLDNTTKELHWYSSGAESAAGDFSTATFGIFRTSKIILNGSSPNAASTNSGDLQVQGGVGIGGSLYVAGVITATTFVGNISGTVTGTASTATNIAGGLSGQIAYQTGPSTTSFVSTGTAGQVLVSGGVGSPVFQSTLTLAGTTASTSTTTGALVVVGGVGIGGNLYVGGSVTATNYLGKSVDLTVRPAVPASGVNGGALNLLGADFDRAGVLGAGVINVVGGISSTGTKGGGTINLTGGGASTGSVYGGFVNITGGCSVWGRGGNVIIYGGTSNSGGSGGSSGYGSNIGGSILIQNGVSYGTGRSGDITLTIFDIGTGMGSVQIGTSGSTSSAIDSSIVVGTYGSLNSGIQIISGNTGTINNMSIGATTAASGRFTTATIISTNNATSTSTGALQVAGGVGIAGNLYVGGTINGSITGSVSGTATTATNIAGGTAGSLPYQSSTSTTTFLSGAGTQGSLLRYFGTAPIWSTTSSLSGGTASSSSVASQSLTITSGGLGVTGASYFSTDVNIAGNLYAGNGVLVNKALVDTVAGNALSPSSPMTFSTDTPYGLQNSFFTGSGSSHLVINQEASSQVSTGDLTLDFWFKPTTNEYGILFQFSGGTYGDFRILKWNSASVGLILKYQGTDYTAGTNTTGGASGAPYTLNAWNHGAFVRSGTNFYVYTNGTKYITLNGIGSPDLAYWQYFGRGYDTWGGSTLYCPNTYFTNVRLTKSALYTGATYTVPTAPLSGGSMLVDVGISNLTGYIYQPNIRFNIVTATTFVGSFTGTVTGTASTATNIAGGLSGQIAYQTGPSTTSFVSTGTAGQVLVSGGVGSPVFQNTLTLAGTTASTSTTTGALVVVGGVGIGGNLYVGGTVYATVTTATTASQVQTVRQTGNSGYYPTFVSANNGSATGMSVYTTSTFAVQPSTGNIGVGTNQFWNWGPLYHVIQKGLVYGDFYGSDSGYAGIAQNLYNDGTKWINKSDANTYPGGLYEQQSNAFTWYSSTGTAYSTATLTTLLNLENGNLSVGYPIGTSLGAKFAVNGGARINGILTATTSTIIGTTVATSTQTGALIVTGGVGVGGNLYVGGLANITYQPASNTGAGIQVSVANSQGGTGYADFLKVTNISSTVTNANKSFRVDNSGTFQIINSTYTGNIFNLTDTGDLTIIGRATFSNVTSATTTNTGALQVAGGAGIGGNVYVGGTITGDIVAATNNGNGTNFKVGDDVWIGDVNLANTMGVKGQQNATVGYIKFGTGSTVGSDGTSFTVSSGMSVTGAGTFTGEVTAYSSDRRLKTNVKPIDNAVDKVLKLNGIIYTWNELAKTLVGYNTNQQVVGLFAQDLEAVLPEAVKLAPFDTDENGISKSGENYKTIQYEKVVPLLVEAIKEQQQQIIQLKNAINILSSKE